MLRNILTKYDHENNVIFNPTGYHIKSFVTTFKPIANRRQIFYSQGALTINIQIFSVGPAINEHKLRINGTIYNDPRESEFKELVLTKSSKDNPRRDEIEMVFDDTNAGQRDVIIVIYDKYVKA